jgi:hypothetical protein
VRQESVKTAQPNIQRPLTQVSGGAATIFASQRARRFRRGKTKRGRNVS